MPHRNQAASANQEGSTDVAAPVGGIREHTLALWQRGEIELSSDQLRMMGFEIAPIGKKAEVLPMKRD